MDPTIVAAWVAAGVSVLTLLGTLAAQYLGYRATSRDAEKTSGEQRRQLDRTLTEQRTRTWNDRFATAAEQLGSDKPAEVRLAGVYAMAGLADDWEANRQTCVDVLCAYLRMPYAPDPGLGADEEKQLAFRATREVRHTVIRIITAHLRTRATVSWEGLDFDFTGAIFDGGDFGGARFSDGLVKFDYAKFSGDDVRFSSVDFSGAWVFFNSAEFSKGTVDFATAQFTNGTVSFMDAKFSGGEVSFHSARFAGGAVWFDSARFSGTEMSFIFAKFFGSEVSFDKTEFSGGAVDFSRVYDWSVPPKFSWTDTPHSGVKFPETSGA